MKPCPFCGQLMSMTQNTYTPRFMCGVCRLDIQKVMVCREAEVPGVWECVRVLTEVGGLSAEELADEVVKTIGESGGEWLTQIFVWKNGFVTLGVPHIFGEEVSVE